MALTVVVHAAAPEPRQLTFDAPRVVIGRSEGCEVCLPDPSISQRHASIRQRGAEYIVLDEGSTNGTFVGPVRLSPGAPRLLRSGDRLRVGRIWLEVRIETAPVTQNPSVATRELALALVAQGLAAQGEPAAMRIEVRDGPSAGKTLELLDAERPYVVGRGQGADLALDDPDLSRRHAQVTRKADRAFVRDLDSKNGSKLDDKPIGSERDVPWPAGRALVIGAHTLVLEDPVRQALREIETGDDERLRDDEVVELPVTAGHTEDAEAAEAPAASSEPPPEPPPRARASRRVPAERTAAGWTATDYLVALMALVVLGMSLVALVWLMQSG